MANWLFGFVLAALLSLPTSLFGQGEWETSPASEKAASDGLAWLARNQTGSGNWGSNDLGLVSLGALAFLSDGHLPDRGKYGGTVRRSLDYVVANAKPSGLLNISGGRRDMYNHGLSVFVLTQAYGVTNDRRIGAAVDKGVQLILDVQCEDGGWAYEAMKKPHGHDLSLAVMQLKALRAATDMGLEIPPKKIELALDYIRARYKPSGSADGKRYGKDPLAAQPGAFTYNGNRASIAMAAAGAVCMQELGEYGDFRIRRSMDFVVDQLPEDMSRMSPGRLPVDAYGMTYVAQAMYQVGGERWRDQYPKIRDSIVRTQSKNAGGDDYGSWAAGGHVSGVPGQLYGTSIAVFALTIPNRYLPILQRGEEK